MRPLLHAIVLTAFALSPLGAQLRPLNAQQKLAREIYKDLVEINTVDSVGSVTKAAPKSNSMFQRRANNCDRSSLVTRR